SKPVPLSCYSLREFPALKTPLAPRTTFCCDSLRHPFVDKSIVNLLSALTTDILLRTAVHDATSRFRYLLKSVGRHFGCGARSSHGARDPTLFLRSKLEDVINQQLTVILIITLERRWDWSCKYPSIILTPEKSRRHRRSRTYGLWVKNPALHPSRFQTLTRQQEIWSGRVLVMCRIPRCVTFQTGSRSAREQTARVIRFFRSQSRRVLWNIRHRLLRQRLEETYQLAKLIVRERERWHPDRQVGPHTIAVRIGGV